MTVLLALITTAPCAPDVTAVTDAVPAKVSLANTAIVSGVSSFVLTASFTASASGVTVTVTVAASFTPPEATVYRKLSEPCQSASGV